MRQERITDLSKVTVGDYLVVNKPFHVGTLGELPCRSMHVVTAVVSSYLNTVVVTIGGSDSRLNIVPSDPYAEFVRITEDPVLVDHTLVEATLEDFIEL